MSDDGQPAGAPDPSGNAVTDPTAVAGEPTWWKFWVRACHHAINRLVPIGPEPTTVRGRRAVAIVGSIFLVGSVGGVLFFFSRWLPSKPAAENSGSDTLPRIALVGPSGDPPYAIGGGDWAPVLKAMLARVDGIDHTMQLGHFKIRFDSVNDLGQPREAAGVAQRICDDQHVIAAIGYVWSTAADSALRRYKQCKEPIPVILIATTADSLPQFVSDATGKRAPILQMPLVNAYQAREIVLGLGDTYSSRDTVRGLLLRSTDNPKYSVPLASKIQRLSKAFLKATINWRIADYEDGTTWEDIKRRFELGPRDVIVYVGNSSLARLLTRGRTRRIGEPLLIVTDGSVNDDFLDHGSEAECVWGTFPVAPSERQTTLRSPSFADFGLAALALVSDWAMSAKPTDQPSRRSFAAYVDSLTQTGRSVPLYGNSSIAFDHHGHSIAVNDDEGDDWARYYHFEQVRRDARGEYRWTHRANRSSLRLCS